ncbi:phospholipase D family protein [Vibrio genomosp. F10]|uniref:Hydrolase n=2 Tax=Vibrio genomosp. F10 TaxID=723171 RepID=A0A1B9R177_9VIBR|nr:phospholipase D family protein [Vibrio genomosp. F10]OCH78047.1 hydrolase [Vibrio genomosp. F10]OEE37504.1 hydrolase [Vibrio genomosp. F10 str. ZF-129]
MAVLQHIRVTLFFVATLTGCASLPEKVSHSTVQVVSPQSSTLSQMSDVYQLAQPNIGMSAVSVLDTGWDALAHRLALIETAEHSIDIQYYIWNSDVSGRYLASRLVAAAERGVKVRLMLDDINLNEREDLLTTLDSHPDIEIRIYNPAPSRGGVTKMVSVLGDFSRLNRRMHNKSFTVDGALSIVGGRNIGDEYFDLSDDINFRDRDALVMGAVVADIEDSFAQYWNSDWSYPVNLLGGEATVDFAELNDSKDLAELTGFGEIEVPLYSDYPALPEGNSKPDDNPEGNKAAKTLLNETMEQMSWVKAQYVSDRPVPVDETNTNQPKATARFMAQLAEQSEHEILLESAYLIFDESQLKTSQMLTSQGVVIKALTNSMASNDLLTNHSGYAGRRLDILESGVQLYELKPDSTLCEMSTRDSSKCAPSAPYGLHTKSAVFDRKIATIGSFNFNLRSTYLNTESLLVIDNKDLAKRLAEAMDQTMNEDHSWRVNLESGEVRWHSGSESWDSEPETGRWERVKSRFLQLLPIEKYL